MQKNTPYNTILRTNTGYLFLQKQHFPGKYARGLRFCTMLICVLLTWNLQLFADTKKDSTLAQALPQRTFSKADDSIYIKLKRTIDSLEKSSSKPNQRLREAYMKMTEHFLYNPDDASKDTVRKYSGKLMKVSEEIGSVGGRVQAYLNFAQVYAHSDSLAEAITVANKALALIRNDTMNNATRLNISLVQGRLGAYYYELGDMENSLKATIDAVKQLKNMPSESWASTGNSNLGTLFSDLKRYDEAEPYLREGLRIAQEIREPKVSASASLMLSTFFIATKQFDSAWKYAELCRQYGTQIPDDEYDINGLLNMAIIQQEQGKTQEVMRLARQVLQLAEETKLEDLIVDGYELLAKAHFAERNYMQAHTFAEKAFAAYLNNNGAFNNVPQRTAELHKLLADIYKQEGNYQKALFHFERQASIRDSVLSAAKQKQLNALISFTEAKKKEQQLTELRYTMDVQSLQLQQRSFALTGVSIGGAFVVIVGFLLYRQRRLQAQQRIAETESRLLRTRLNPHLWFNALSSVQHHLLSGASPRDSAKYLSKIASVMRQSLESSYQDMISLTEELEFAEKYLGIQQLRLNHSFAYIIDISPDINPDETLIPSMLLEPFLENTIEHGFRGIEEWSGREKACITMRIEPHKGVSKQTKSLLSITIEDNGVGLTAKTASAHGHRSRAVEITQERLQLLAPTQKQDVGVSIQDRTSAGVEVKIILPLLT